MTRRLPQRPPLCLRAALVFFLIAAAAPSPRAAGTDAAEIWLAAHQRFFEGDLDGALAGANTALEAARSRSDTLTEARSLDLIGNVHFDWHRPDRAIGFFEQSLAAARRAGNREAEATALKDTGITYRHLGRHDEGITRLYEALDAYRELDDPLGTFSATENLGQAYLVIGAYRFAMDAFDDALGLASTTYKDSRSAFNLQMRLGLFSLELNRPRTALEHFRQATEIAETIDIPANVRNWLAMGYSSALLDCGMIDEAIQMRQQSVEQSRRLESRVSYAGNLAGYASFIGKRDTDQGIATLLEAISMLEAEQAGGAIWNAYRDLGRLRRERGQIDEAIAAFDRAARDIDSTRARMLSETHRASFFEKHQGVYRDLVDALLTRARQRPGDGDDRRAFAVLERGRARAMLAAIAETRADLTANLSPELGERQLHLNARIVELQNRLASSASAEERRRASDALTRAEEAADSLVAEIKRENPRYAALRYPESLTVESTQALLAEDTALLAYAVTPERSTCFVVTRDGFSAVPLPVSEDVLAARVANYTDLISRDEPDGWQRIGERLSEDLIAPVRSALRANTRRLVIAPDGILFYLPFETLPPGGPGKFLLEEFVISYTPSATVLSELRTAPPDPPSNGNTSVLVVADPFTDQAPEAAGSNAERLARDLYDDEDLTVARLPATKTEASAIVRHARGGSEVYLGAAASEYRVKQTDLARYGIIHFATHGLVSSRAPSRSALVLSHTAGDGEDGFLQAREIYQMRLSCDLVVLSACQTARGGETPGDGVQGLARAFLHAGSRSVVASLWNVNDERTAVFMDAFYRHLAANGSRAEALRAAKLELLASPHTSAPRFWAPFVLIGEADAPVAIGRGTSLSPAGGIVPAAATLLALALFVLLWKRRAGTASRNVSDPDLASPSNLR